MRNICKLLHGAIRLLSFVLTPFPMTVHLALISHRELLFSNFPTEHLVSKSDGQNAEVFPGPECSPCIWNTGLRCGFR